MCRPILIAISDCHLAPGAWPARDVRGDAFFSLQQIVDYAIEHATPSLAAGDLYDREDPCPATVAVMQAQIARLQRAELPIFYNVGQHDRHVAWPWMQIGPWPSHLESDHGYFTVSTAAGDFRVAGWDWVTASFVPDMIKGIPDEVLYDPRGIVLTHQVWLEFLRFEGMAEGSLSAIPGCCTLVCGDHHGGDESARSMRVGEHLVLSPGSIAMQSINEPARKYFWVLEEHEDKTLRWRLEPLKVRAVFKYQARDEAAVAALPAAFEQWFAEYRASGLADELPESLRRPLAGIWFYDDQAGVLAVARQIKDAAHVFLKPQSRKKQMIVAEPGLRPASYHGLLDVLDQVVPVADPRRGPLETLLLAPDLDGALRELKDGHFSRPG